MSERANSRDRHSRRHRRHRPRHHTNTRTASASQNGVTNDQGVQNQTTSATLNDASAAHTTPSDLSYTTTAPWTVNPALANNGLGSHHASSLQYLSAPEGNSNVWTDNRMDPNHQISYNYGHSDQAPWSALNNYANAPPRDDAWSPWVMSAQDRVEGGDTEVGEGEDGNGKGREESNQNGV